ncbi:30S ribosomal protein S9 [Candidatus Roizmanbacteria bacterium]|nr:30S ribosomal protein S9 [Candidatus Roizmanbacteria bacterium]
MGRRKESVARVRLYISNKNKPIVVNGRKMAPGDIIINNQPFEKILSREIERKKSLLPLEITDSLQRFAISTLVRGGGAVGQIEAIQHGIARALLLVDPDAYKTILRQHNLVTRDYRVKERRKVGTGGKARRKKQSPKR